MIGTRKLDHLKLCQEMDVEYRDKTTLLEDVHLVHQALAGLSFDDIRTETRFMGRKLKAPILITAMSGGVARARDLNRDLASAAQELGIGFCLGSQRPMLEDPKASASYQVRRFAPDIPIVGNIGIQQAALADPDKVAGLVSAIEADGLAVHVNPALFPAESWSRKQAAASPARQRPGSRPQASRSWTWLGQAGPPGPGWSGCGVPEGGRSAGGWMNGGFLPPFPSSRSEGWAS
ncbi:MAG: alpha-hydroxy-acid oxidizing protein [Elusimicrobia bacterium]|nr:alpha-hydroxy-acid oxidizing protein [Elusimicrobiota bacterium]